MRLKIEHQTVYTFETPVSYGLQQIRKTPKAARFQKVLHWETNVAGGVKEVTFEDHHHNATELVSFAPGTRELSVTSRGEVELSDDSGIVGPHRGPVPLWLYLRETPRTQAARACARCCARSAPRRICHGLHDLSAGIRDRIAFEIGASESPVGAPKTRSRPGAVSARTTPMSSSPARAGWACPRAMSLAT